MTYNQQDGQVTIEMSRDDYDTLLLIIGFAAGAALHGGDADTFWRWMKFINKLNATNPRFTPYEIPPEFSAAAPCCASGDHVPAIVHRTGGPSAESHNRCGRCGLPIVMVAGRWMVDPAESAAK